MAEQRRHAVQTQAAGMEYGRHKVRPQGVHLHHRAYAGGVKEVVGVAAAGQRRTSRRLRGYGAQFSLLAKHLAEEGRRKP